MNVEEFVKKNNPIIYDTIANAFKNKKISHAYIFSAQKHHTIDVEPLFLIEALISRDGKKRIANTYADLSILDGSQGLISKEMVTNVVSKLQQTALDKLGVKILYIKNIEAGNSQSLNSLLKFWEEPTPNTFVVATTNNLSQVLSTIRSRSQIINVRSLPFETFVKVLVEQKIELRRAKILAAMCSSIEEALNLNKDSDFWVLFEKILTAMALSLRNHNKIFTELAPLITKQNYMKCTSVLRIFLNDLWKINGVSTVVLDDEWALIENFKSTHFDFQKALFSINDFVINQDSFVNFDLSKSKLMIELEQCYG